MRLASVDGLTRASSELWQSMGARLRHIGLNQTGAETLRKMGAELFMPLRRAVGLWHARQVHEPYAYALRVLELADPITEAELHTAFGKDLSRNLLNAGFFIECEPGLIGSPFRLSYFRDIFIISDPLRPGGMAVMGPGGTTEVMAAAARPMRAVARLLDVGCGAGSCALLFAASADVVVATDVNPRALELARINSLINGITNVELREGDLFEPVRNEQFDWIVAQPPYVPRPPGTIDTLYLYGGARGDELPLRLLQGAAEHLCVGGRAAVLTDWPELAGEAIDGQIATAMNGQNCGVLLLHGPFESADNLAAVYAAAHCESLDSDLDRAFETWRDHLSQMKIERVHPTLNMIENLGSNEKSWSGNHFVQQWGLLQASAADRLFENWKLLAAGDQALLDATLRLPQGTKVYSESIDTDSTNEMWHIICPPYMLAADMEGEPVTCEVLKAIDASPTVSVALADHGDRLGLTASEFLHIVRSWIESGVLSDRDRLEPVLPLAQESKLSKLSAN